MDEISRETALQLREAGWIALPGCKGTHNPEEDFYYPTTDELIVASKVREMKRDPVVGWWADHCGGKTLKEALCRLWLDRQTFEDGLN